MTAGEAFERIPASMRKVLIVALPLVLAGSCFAVIANGVDEEQASAPSTVTAPTLTPPSTPSPTPTVTADAWPVLAAALALKVIEHKPPAGYSGDEFGQRWKDIDHNGCDQLNDVLRRDMYSLHTKPGTHGCVLAKGELADPYDVLQKISFIRGRPGVEVDHVVALKNAWKTGASHWSARKRERFANDPLNLLATSSQNNREKGDSDISEWKPWPDDCAYAVRQVSIKTKYGLQVSRREKEALIATLRQAGCRNEEPRLMKSSDKNIRIPAPKPVGEPKPKPRPSPTPKPSPIPKANPTANAKPHRTAPPPSTSPPARSLPTVHPGAICSPVGARGVTVEGTPMVCKTTGTQNRARWRGY